MMSGIYEVIDSSLAQQLRFATISNNLSNINTNAFKKEIMSFDQALTMNIVSATVFSPGPTRYTGNELDVAISGPGFFKVQTPRGIRYTRNGSFTINSEGLLVTRNGDAILGQNGPISINSGKISIGIDGQVAADNEPVDKIVVVDFEAPQQLKKEGMSYYGYQGGEEGVYNSDNINIQQGYIENSNVNPTEEMIKMVEALRLFESAQKAIQCLDEVNQKMVNDVGLLQ
ncbi:MAG TPA: flagellar hook-basal body protein [Desulfatiglandales bacterium]|nr:flagellar hook-basal body protein [Desulfatiglandales bacterium]